MAQVRKRTRKDGGISYQVIWVLGGGRGRPQQAETFTSEARARAFK